MTRLGRIALSSLALLACSDASSVEGRISDPAGGDTVSFGAQRVQLLRDPDSARVSDSTLCAEYLAADSAVAVRFAGTDSSRRIEVLEEHGDLIDHFASDVGAVFTRLALQTDTADADGRFSFSNIPAGEYALFTMGRTRGSVGWWWDEVAVGRGVTVNQELTSVVPVRSWCETRYGAGRPSAWGSSGPP